MLPFCPDADNADAAWWVLHLEDFS
jgi:hypothetical protein